jgi:hypothetical protein
MPWALIVDGAVREITDSDPAGRYHPSLHWQPCDGDVREGDLWTGAAFAPPPPSDAPLPRSVSALGFRRRFTPEERAAITLAASRGLEAGDATLQVWLDDLNSAVEVHLDNPEIADALDMLVDRGLLAAPRRAELLA